jgi:Metal-dependent hydrolase
MRKRSYILRPFAWCCALILGAALVIAYISIYVNPGTNWVPAFFGLYFVPLVIANLLLLLFFALRRSKVAWCALLALLPTILYADLFVRWGADDKPEQEGVSFRLASYNVCNFQGYGNKDRQSTMQEIYRTLVAENVDIVCMQEFYFADSTQVFDIFSAYPYHYLRPQKSGVDRYFGNAVFSKYPIQNHGFISLSSSGRHVLYADFMLHGRSFRVYTTHLESNKISLTALADRLYKHPDASEEVLAAHRRIRDAFRGRALQVDHLSHELSKTTIPFILCGDFNDTPVSYAYHHIQRQLHDSFREAGHGFGATFRYLWPSLRIDYIFYGDAFRAYSHSSPRLPYSDHYPVIADLIIL